MDECGLIAYLTTSGSEFGIFATAFYNTVLTEYVQQVRRMSVFVDWSNLLNN